MPTPTTDIAIYTSHDGMVSFAVNVFSDSVWLTQAQIAELFDKAQSTISAHISNIFTEGELEENSVHRKFRYTAKDGKSYRTSHYNLDVVISVGYRVKSIRGTQFRQWANRIITHHLMDGYTINEARIAAIEKKLDSFSDTVKAEFGEIKQAVSALTNRPIQIQNQIHIDNQQLENEIIKTLNTMIKSSADAQLNTELTEIQHNLKQVAIDPLSKNKIIHFFKNIGDEQSPIHQAITGAGMTKSIICELIKFGDALLKIFT